MMGRTACGVVIDSVIDSVIDGVIDGAIDGAGLTPRLLAARATGGRDLREAFHAGASSRQARVLVRTDVSTVYQGGRSMRRLVFCIVLVSAGLLLVPTVSTAQGTSTGSIAGAVKDSSGAVLPGVTVEASSPALIEKVRTTTTDDKGEYKITELRPGTYAVTFALPGFNTFKRDGLQLSPNFTATINATLAIGSIQETVTVSGATPLVDTQNVSQQRTISKELLDAVPTSKSMLALASLMPSVVEPPNAQDV